MMRERFLFSLFMNFHDDMNAKKRERGREKEGELLENFHFISFFHFWHCLLYEKQNILNDP